MENIRFVDIKKIFYEYKVYKKNWKKKKNDSSWVTESKTFHY